MLGPMVNPCQPQKQLVGVYSLQLLRLYSYLYQKNHKAYAIVHALDGYDEISLNPIGKSGDASRRHDAGCRRFWTKKS